MDRARGEFDTPKAPYSPYAAELQRGPIAPRFAVSLEREYQRTNLQRTRTRVQRWQLALLLAGLLNVLMHFVIMRQPVGANFDTLLRLVLLLPACVVMTVVAWGRHYEHGYPRVAPAGSVVVSVVGAILVAGAVIDGRAEALTFLTTNIMAVFFLAGLMYFHAVLICLLSLISFAVAAAMQGMAMENLLFDSTVLAIVVMISALIGSAVEEANRRYFLERGVLGELAERDGLTGLRNRRAFDEHLLRVWQQSLRDHSAIAILMIDLDYFKAYNDQYGHQAGDQCLRHVAQVVQRFARRPLDLAARYGGEELAVVLYQPTVEQARAVAEQLRATVAGAGIEHKGSAIHGIVTVSVGLAWIEASLDCSPQDAVQVADEALYTAKLEGRNRVVYPGAKPAQTFNRGLQRTSRPVR